MIHDGPCDQKSTAFVRSRALGDNDILNDMTIEIAAQELGIVANQVAYRERAMVYGSTGGCR